MTSTLDAVAHGLVADLQVGEEPGGVEIADVFLDRGGGVDFTDRGAHVGEDDGLRDGFGAKVLDVDGADDRALLALDRRCFVRRGDELFIMTAGRAGRGLVGRCSGLVCRHGGRGGLVGGSGGGGGSAEGAHVAGGDRLGGVGGLRWGGGGIRIGGGLRIRAVKGHESQKGQHESSGKNRMAQVLWKFFQIFPFTMKAKVLENAYRHFPRSFLRLAQEFGDDPEKRQANYRNLSESFMRIEFGWRED